MSSDVERHVIERIEAAPIRQLPSPHFFIEEIFPAPFYRDLLANLPSNDDFVALSETGRVRNGAFDKRFVFFPRPNSIDELPASKQAFWREMNWLYSRPLMMTLCRKFAWAFKARFAAKPDGLQIHPDVLVVRDRAGFEIGPHTDTPTRFVSLLFYCPPDDSHESLGTSLYMPRDREFECEGGPHYPFDKFVEVGRMPFRHNCLFGFLKTRNSFHGVPPIEDETVERDILLYNLRVGNVPEPDQSPATG